MRSHPSDLLFDIVHLVSELLGLPCGILARCVLEGIVVSVLPPTVVFVARRSALIASALHGKTPTNSADGHPENCYKLKVSLWQNQKGDFVDEEEKIFGRADRIDLEAS